MARAVKSLHLAALTASQFRVAKGIFFCTSPRLVQYAHFCLFFGRMNVCSQSFERITNTPLRFSLLCTSDPHGAALFLFETICCGLGLRASVVDGDGCIWVFHRYPVSQSAILSVHPQFNGWWLYSSMAESVEISLHSFSRLPFWVTSVQDIACVFFCQSFVCFICQCKLHVTFRAVL